ncbi:helix-turn-helix transcriptional regulator [Paenibacillus allorhizosphaerae]|uniref:YafY family transcriptional regulator n=1 Tax=Paenibacillus allorhizosphaerae TaxID=2849866 RepID=A0ABM8VR11_9BACL|nr:YafY family protein [Paenibacillus allorhizosphaerae]CAG7654841.1 hypothetical protein PAECIP111802_05902 [Paenibacillus allorhizosphaerae]
MSKADHMLGILMLLRARKKMSAHQLAQELEIHIRTVYRCIDALCISGVPIVSETGRDGGYYIPDHFKLEPLFFDVDEQKSLLHAAQFARESGYPYEKALNRAVAKIKRYAASEQSKRLDAQESHLEVVHPPANVQLAPKLLEIEKAVDAQTRLELQYYTGYEGSMTMRIFDPYGLVNWKDKWYVVGFCHLRGEIRHFRVDRIGRIRLTDSVFVRPSSFSARESLLESLLPETGDESSEHLVSVQIQGLPQAMNDLCGHWLFARTLVERTTNWAHFKLDEHSLYLHAPYYLLSFGGKIQILEPMELNVCLMEIAESLAQYYQT